jgi:quercetin dioxygenase-like cupin family protein
MRAEPEVLWMPGGVRTEVHLRSEHTGGAFCLLVDEPPAGWELGPHRHLGEAETIHVLRGEFEMVIEGERVRAGEGQTIHVPKGALHEGGNVGSESGRRLVIFSPAGVEGFFLEVGAPSADAEVDWRAIAQAAERHGWEVLARNPQP